MKTQLHYKGLQALCALISRKKSRLVGKLPHYAHLALYFHDDSITTGLINNNEEISIKLVTGQLIHSKDEKNEVFDITRKSITNQARRMLGDETEVQPINSTDLKAFHKYAAVSSLILESFRISLTGHFTMVHLWPEHFDFSVEWFPGKKDEQVGTGISPGDEQYRKPYFYMNPWPFNDKVTDYKLPTGIWHTHGWKGVKVELDDLISYEGNGVENVKELFSVVKKNFTN